MFNGATSFNQPLNNWNTSLVTTMANMFQGASSFNQPLNSWNTSKVTSMGYMFQGATSFNQPTEIGIPLLVQVCIAMFQSATSFNQPIGNWNTSKVTTMYKILLCNLLLISQLGKFGDTSSSYKYRCTCFVGLTSFKSTNRNLGYFKSL
jgi:surface protein